MYETKVTAENKQANFVLNIKFEHTLHGPVHKQNHIGESKTKSFIT
jgi:hypothetical protein